MKKQLIPVLITLAFINISIVMGQTNNIDTPLFLPDHSSIRYVGRIDFENLQKPKLISAGSFLTFSFTGTHCSVLLDYEFGSDGYAFIAVECDGNYLGRIKVYKGHEKYEVVSGLANTIHSIRICKATEAITGYIEVKGIVCNSMAADKQIPVHSIEFIGNSITSGAESDSSEYPCSSAVWHDRHNAYLAYGPRLARKLDADWVLSSVSGMGLTRNWNSEGPALPAYYDNLYLNSDFSRKWTGKEYNPELVTICLGANDYSTGDGSYDRKPIDSAVFVNEYIRFVKHIRQRYPAAIICLINSPVFDGDLRLQFQRYLESTVNAVKKETGDQKVFYFSYKHKYEGGCSGHPNTEEHQKMADELLPFIRKITGW